MHALLMQDRIQICDQSSTQETSTNDLEKTQVAILSEKFCLKKDYSQIFVQRQPLGLQISGHCWQVIVVQRSFM